MTMVTVSASDRRTPLELHVAAPGVMHVLSGGGSCVVDLGAGEEMTVSAGAPQKPTVGSESLLDRMGDAVRGVWDEVLRGGEDVSEEAADAYHHVLDAIGWRREPPVVTPEPAPAPETPTEK